MSSNIKLKDIFGIPESEYERYRVHFAVTNSEYEDPLDVFLTNKEQWLAWNENRRESIAQSNRNRQHDYIISFVKFHSDWLFAGIFAIDDKKTKFSNEKSEFTGRMVVSFPGKPRTTLFHFVTCIDDLIVKEILDQPIESKQFTGYKNVHLTFSELKHIVDENSNAWREKLSAIGGIYLIHDTVDHKNYIGSATGYYGIWQRWSDYARSNATGGNKLLCELMGKKDENYPGTSLEFTLLEFYFEGQFDDEYVLDRENYWKDVLHSRNKDIGLNLN